MSACPWTLREDSLAAAMSIFTDAGCFNSSTIRSTGAFSLLVSDSRNAICTNMRVVGWLPAYRSKTCRQVFKSSLTYELRSLLLDLKCLGFFPESWPDHPRRERARPLPRRSVRSAQDHGMDGRAARLSLVGLIVFLRNDTKAQRRKWGVGFLSCSF
jgi:hypothetical protein